VAHKDWPLLGCGVGLRNEHYDFILESWPEMDFFEVISENFMDSGGRPAKILEKVRAHYPVILHGTSLSIASTDPLSQKYLKRLKALVHRIDPLLVSDHLCWSGVGGHALHDLLPIPQTEEAVRHIVSRVGEVQDFLGRQILLENVSTYVTYKHSEMPEWEFISEISKRSGCGILLDLNNVYVNSFNHKFDPYVYLENIPGEKVGQFHLAGHADKGEYLFDTHNARVIDPVWKLYEKALEKWGKISTLIEWDEDIPDFSVLSQEASKARCYYEKARERMKMSDELPQHKVEEAKGPSLEKIEKWMKGHIQPLPQKETVVLTPMPLNPQGHTDGEKRLDVYAEGYFVRIHDALLEAYPATQHILGASVFAKIAEKYARTFPSCDYNLSLAGIHLPEFLKREEKTKDLPFLPDLSRLEWFVSESFHAFHQPAQNLSEVTQYCEEDWENLRIIFQSSLNLVSSDWPIIDLWKARKTPRNEIKVDLVNRPQKALIYRKDTQVFVLEVEDTPYRLLEQLRKGERLGDALESLENLESSELDLQKWFSNWVSLGLVTSLQITPSSSSI